MSRVRGSSRAPCNALRRGRLGQSGLWRSAVGAGLVGCEAADYLSEQGCRVILVEVLPVIASDGDADTQAYYYMKFAANDVTIYTETQIIRLEKGAALLEKDGRQIEIPIASVVLAVGAEADDSLYEELSATGIACVKIGDCLSPRRILDAIHEGFQAGCGSTSSLSLY